MATGEALKASKDLLMQTDGIQVVGCFCLFAVPRLNGRNKVEDSNTKYTNLVDVDDSIQDLD